MCEIAAVAFSGTALYENHYRDSENIDGSLEEQYQRGMAFIKRNLHHVQGNQGFNSLGQLEIPEDVFVELLVNALVHRDYFTNATIRLFVFADRVEIISPGHLPDTLTAEQIRAGRSNRRNKVLAGHAMHIFPYRGMGTGIPRVLHAWSRIDLTDDRDGNQFTAVVWRPAAGQQAEPSPETNQASTGQVLRLLSIIDGEHSRNELQTRLQLKHRDSFTSVYLQPALTAGMVEMTLPDKPHSSKQRYRLTERGKAVLAEHLLLSAHQHEHESTPPHLRQGSGDGNLGVFSPFWALGSGMSVFVRGLHDARCTHARRRRTVVFAAPDITC
ncbi:hypothetical protein AGMMS50256_00810 [Betaproteobacteria bacterium]|nr:hypothetical protein AGMMS50256_00810 [Betaproteobacteria bacterium]